MINRTKVLVVEDTYLVARDIQDTLTSLGYLVTAIVDSGKEAVDKAVSTEPDLILMDIKLKGNMDGIEAASLISEQLDIPIIYLTAIADDYTLLRAKRTEPSGYIIKPFNKADLHSAIEMALYKYKMENFLKDREELLTTTLKSVSEAVMTTDINGYLTFLNRNAEQLTGCQQEDILGTHIDTVFTLMDEKTGRITPNPYSKVVHDGVRTELKNQLLKSRQKRIIPVLNINDPIIDDKGNIIGAVISLRDISEQKKIQKELEKAQKLEAIAIRAKSIGHEFNNLLTVIRGNLDLLKHSIESTGSMYNLLDDAEKAAIRASDLTNQFLAFSKEEGLYKRPESVSEIIRTTANSVFGDSSIQCTFILPDDIRKVDVDKGQISQVFYTILRIIYNTIDEKGKIKIAAENIIIRERDMIPVESGNYVKILIRGQGIQSQENFIKQVFDPYFDDENQNEGLELSNSYAVVKKHEGYISIESNQDTGMGFYIYLPVATETGSPVEKPKKSRNVEGERRILVMDDQELVRIIAGKMLAFMGYEVEFARHGAEALEIYQHALDVNQPFDCVILDLTIPWGLGARETIGQLLEIDEDVKAVVSTGYSNDPSLYDYKDLGFMGVIKKPYELQELNKVLKDVIGT